MGHLRSLLDVGDEKTMFHAKKTMFHVEHQDQPVCMRKTLYEIGSCYRKTILMFLILQNALPFNPTAFVTCANYKVVEIAQ